MNARIIVFAIFACSFGTSAIQRVSIHGATNNKAQSKRLILRNRGAKSQRIYASGRQGVLDGSITEQNLFNERRGAPDCAPSCTSRPMFGKNGLSLAPRVWLAVGPLTESESLTDGLQAFGGIQEVMRKSPKFLHQEMKARRKFYVKTLSKGKNHSEILDHMREENLVQLQPAKQENLPKFPSDAGPGGTTVWAFGYRDDSDRQNPAVVVNFTEALEVAGRSIAERVEDVGGFAVGNFTMAVKSTVLIRCTDTFYLDNRVLPFVGDVYDGGRAVHAMHLSKGEHQIFVRFSGSAFWCDIMEDSKEAREQTTGVNVTGSARSPLVVLEDHMISDVVDGYLASPFVAVPVLYVGHKPLTTHSVTVIEGADNVFVDKLHKVPIVSGQVFTLRLKLKQDGPIKCTNITEVRDENGLDRFIFNISLRLSAGRGRASARVQLEADCYSFRPGGSPPTAAAGGYRVTFPDFDGSIQEMWVAPPNVSMGKPSDGFPIMLSLHGAQVETGPNWGHNYAQGNYLEFAYPAWLVQPSNRFEWGTDWQGPGFDNAVAAMQYLSDHLPGVPHEDRDSLNVDEKRMLVTGHSMGGHGCLLYSTHEPDRLLGSVCAAPWPSMEHYGGGPSLMLDPARAGLLQADRSENAADYLASNFRGVPLTLVYGNIDDNVPPSEPRYMARVVSAYSENTSAVKIIELPDTSHWFRQNCPEMASALWEHFPMDSTKSGGLREFSLPQFPERFEFTVMNPSTFGTKGNLKVLQQSDAGKPAKLFVSRCTSSSSDEICNQMRTCGTQPYAAEGHHDLPWIIDTENVRRFTFIAPPSEKRPLPSVVRIDGKYFNVTALNLDDGFHFCSTDGHDVDAVKSWHVCTGRKWETVERGGPSAGTGPLQMVLRRAPLCIVHGSATGHEQQALALANKLYFVSRYSVPIINGTGSKFDSKEECANANLILIGHPLDNPWTTEVQCSFDYVEFLSGYSRGFKLRGQTYTGPRIGLVALGQLGGGRLGLLLHGTDAYGLARAGQRVPISSWQSAGDFFVIGPDAGWAGSNGLLATGYLDPLWKPSLFSSWAEREHSVGGATTKQSEETIKRDCRSSPIVSQRAQLQEEAVGYKSMFRWRTAEDGAILLCDSSAMERLPIGLLFVSIVFTWFAFDM